MNWQIIPFSETSLLINFSGDSMEALNDCVHQMDTYCSGFLKEFLIERVPAYNSLLLVCKGAKALNTVQQDIETKFGFTRMEKGGAPVEEIIIPVCYDLSLGNDLPAMAEFHRLSPAEMINFHIGQSYHVYMLGFLPGFAYMGEVNERIATPRKPVPVPTRAGAVGIAGRQTGIYPLNSPGGWNIAGYTPLPMFDVKREQPALLKPGDRVRFISIDLESYHDIQKNGNGSN